MDPGSPELKTSKFSFHDFSFSLQHLAVFMIAFAALGSYFLYQSFALGPQVARVEAETMVLPLGASVINDSTASASQAVRLTANGKLSSTFSTTSAAADLSVVAKSNRCKGNYATMQVLIDNLPVIGPLAVNSGSYKAFNVHLSASLPSGSHSLDIIYSSALSTKNCNRYLTVDVSALYGVETPPPPPASLPTVALTANPTTVTSGSSSTLSWSSTNATSCTASGAWSGSRATSGTETTSALTAAAIYTLSCTGSGGTATATVTVNVGAPLSIQPSLLPNATQGQNYSQQVTTSDGNSALYTLKVTQGNLPAGVIFDGSYLMGTPTQSGTFAFTISSFNTSNVYLAFRDYSLFVSATPPPSGTWPPAGAYFYDDFASGLTKWFKEGVSSSFAVVDDNQGGKAAALTVGPNSTGPNSSSELASLYLSPSTAHAGYQKPAGEEAWYRHGIRFPAGFRATTGEWNWFIEWHTDTKTQLAGGNSTGLDVLTDYPVTTNPGINPRLRFRVAGGSPSSPTYKYITLPSNSLRYDYWYDSVYHIIWSADSSVGLLEWWLDGQLMGTIRAATLYVNSDGTKSYNGFGLYHYRLKASWDSTVHFRKVVIGPTRSGVGF